MTHSVYGFLLPEARTIMNLCSMRLLHRVDEAADDLAEWFGLTEREVNWGADREGRRRRGWVLGGAARD